MAKDKLSIGDDTPSGEPENGPRGPYITDTDEDASRPHGRLPPDDAGSRTPRTSRTESRITREGALASDNAAEGRPSRVTPGGRTVASRRDRDTPKG